MSLEQVIVDCQDDLDAARVYIQDLEEYVRATLWIENLIVNEGASANEGEDGFSEHNRRVDRLRNATQNLPLYLFDEIGAEDRIIYKGMDDEIPEGVIDQDSDWKFLIDRGLVVVPSQSCFSAYEQHRTEFMERFMENT